MKKIFIALLAALILLALFAVTACAVEAIEVVAEVAQGAGAIEEIAEGGGLPTEPFTWAYLATIAGATAATLLIVQFLKLPLDKAFGHIPTRMVAYLIALVLMLVATAFTTGLTAENALLAAVNAFVVALAAMGTYEVTFGRKHE